MFLFGGSQADDASKSKASEGAPATESPPKAEPAQQDAPKAPSPDGASSSPSADATPSAQPQDAASSAPKTEPIPVPAPTGGPGAMPAAGVSQPQLQSATSLPYLLPGSQPQQGLVGAGMPFGFPGSPPQYGMPGVSLQFPVPGSPPQDSQLLAAQLQLLNMQQQAAQQQGTVLPGSPPQSSQMLALMQNMQQMEMAQQQQMMQQLQTATQQNMLPQGTHQQMPGQVPSFGVMPPGLFGGGLQTQLSGSSMGMTPSNNEEVPEAEYKAVGAFKETFMTITSDVRAVPSEIITTVGQAQTRLVKLKSKMNELQAAREKYVDRLKKFKNKSGGPISDAVGKSFGGFGVSGLKMGMAAAREASARALKQTKLKPIHEQINGLMEDIFKQIDRMRTDYGEKQGWTFSEMSVQINESIFEYGLHRDDFPGVL